jgi:hypothetical protein
MSYVMWAGIDGHVVVCDGPAAKESCAQMRDGLFVMSNGFPLAAVKTSGALHYGIVFREFDGPPRMDFTPETTAFPIRQAKVALARLGITGPVALHVAEAEVRRAVH